MKCVRYVKVKFLKTGRERPAQEKWKKMKKPARGAKKMPASNTLSQINFCSFDTGSLYAVHADLELTILSASQVVGL
jgi:hypothetical protein